MRLNGVKIGEVERLDRHHKAILDFIKNSPQRTENQVVKAMEDQKVCSKMTTLRKLDELIEKQEIKDLLKIGETGFHSFIINEDNEFNRISKELTEIEGVINDFQKYQNLVKQWCENQHHFVIIPNEEIFLDKVIYLITLNTKLINLLGKLDIIIKSEKDSQILYRKINILLHKLYNATERGPEILIPILFQMFGKKTLLFEWIDVRTEFDKLKSSVPKSEHKNLLESIEFEKNIRDMQIHLAKSLMKAIPEIKVNYVP